MVHLSVVGDQLHMHAHAGHACVAENHDVQRPEIRRRGTHGDQRVHGE